MERNYVTLNLCIISVTLILSLCLRYESRAQNVEQKPNLTVVMGKCLLMMVRLTAVQLTLANCVYIAHLPHLKVGLFSTSFDAQRCYRACHIIIIIINRFV